MAAAPSDLDDFGADEFAEDAEDAALESRKEEYRTLADEMVERNELAERKEEYRNGAEELVANEEAAPPLLRIKKSAAEA